MSTYRAPMQEIQFVMNELAGLEQVGKLPGYEDATPDTVAAILEQASKFASKSSIRSTLSVTAKARHGRRAGKSRHRPDSRRRTANLSRTGGTA